jgi:RNA polymerase sigma-70 factor (ECF subfamily)
MTAFIKIFKHIGKFAYMGEGSLEGWMRKIFVNESLMWLRSRHNFNMVESLDEALSEADLEQLTAWEAEDIIKLIISLPTGYRTVFNLYAIEGYSHHEIAQMLSIAETTSRSQLFKAKASLKKLLIKEGFQYGT